MTRTNKRRRTEEGCTWAAFAASIICISMSIANGQTTVDQTAGHDVNSLRAALSFAPVASQRQTNAQSQSEPIGASCPVNCPPGGGNEFEPCGSNFNFGCIGSCPMFQAGFSKLTCGEASCGTAWAEAGSYDTDWWKFTIQDNGSNTGEVQVCLTVETEFNAVVELYSGFICAPTLVAQFEVAACDGPQTICECLPITGNWYWSAHWVRVYPGTIGGGPMTDGLPCAAGDGDYTLELECTQPCPDMEYELGACCTPQLGGPCVQATESYCEEHLDGIWHGAGTPCWPDPCPAFGACCYRYSPDSDYFPCIETWEDDCHDNYLEGIFHGNFVACDDVECPGSSCGAGAGDCLLPNGSPGCEHEACCAVVCDSAPQCCGDQWDQQCAFLAFELCWDMDLDPPLGACCYVIPGTNDIDCVETTEDDCLFSGNYESPSWAGGVTCAEQFDQCIEDYFGVGSCCYIDADGTERCIITTQANCEQNLFGDFLPNGSCDDGDCPVVIFGACCYEDPAVGWQCVQTVQEECDGLPGSTFHPWQSCTPNPCPQSDVGACCRTADDGSVTCVQLSPDECEAVNGVFHGFGVPCDPFPCEQGETGACCVIDADGNSSCIQVGSADECDAIGGDFQGIGVPCTDDLCPDEPTGACCYVDATGELSCSVVTESTCAQLPQGAYQGDGTTCSPNPCTCTGDEAIVIRSGQSGGVPGQVGDLDDTLRGVASTACAVPLSGAAFTAADFAAAQSGPAPFIVNPNAGWMSLLPSDPQARWINVNINPNINNEGRPPVSALYAAEFFVDSTCINTEESCLDICWAVDDRLGDPAGGPNPVGAYLNGVPIDLAFSGGNFTGETCINHANLPMLQQGLNTLYLYQRDEACVVSGLIFSATVTVEGGNCPGDLNCDGVVNGADLLIMLSSWGPCAGCPGDLNNDGVINGADLLIMLSSWGGCP